MTMKDERPAVMSRELEAELEATLKQAEAAVAELRQELDAARAQRRQREEIDRLEEHFAQTRLRWEEVRSFFDDVLRELREQKGSDSQS